MARHSHKKALAAFTSLMVLFALVVPMAGSAFATHLAEPVAVVDLEPEADQAAVSTCNAFSVTLRDDDTGVGEGETVDILAEQVFPEDADPTNDPILSFCVPTTSPEAADSPTGGGAGAGQGDECPTDPALANPNQDCATLSGEFVADAEGEVFFGIRSNTEGPMLVTAFAEAQSPACTAPQNTNNLPDPCEPQDSANKLWTAGGAAGVDKLDCTPETATNNLGAGDTTHTFTCTATNAAGDPVGNVPVRFEITKGPNSDIQAVPGQQDQEFTCGNTTAGDTGTAPTGTVGVVQCQYSESADGEANETGTDTIIVYVDQDGDTEPDNNEPSDEILKTWTFGARNIDCSPETAENNPGDEPHVVTCTVTDREGKPVGGTTVTFSETGPGRFNNNQPTTTAVTDANGVATATTTAQQNEEGTQEITGTITDENQTTGGDQLSGECDDPAGQPVGAPAGNCADAVLKNWVEPGAAPQCGDGIDNDGDGLVDFPNDPGCTSANDATESPNPGPEQCRDGVDNDADGLVDFPNDPGCASATDNSEAGTTPDPEIVRHPRTINITRIRHIFLPGQPKPALLIKGVVKAPSFVECASEVPIKVQIRAGGEWITRKTDTTNANGVWKVLIRDIEAKYRARATKFEIADPSANVVHVCGRATDVRRHSH